MNKNKTEIIKAIGKCIEDTFNELDEVNEEISSEKKKLVAITVEYANINNAILEQKRSIEKETSELKREKDSFAEEKAEFNIAVSRNNERKASLENELAEKVKSRDIAKKEIDSLSEKLQSLSIQVKAKQTLTEELESISRLVVEKTDELKRVSGEYSDKVNKYEGTIAYVKNELEEITNEIEKKKNIVLPTIEALNKREKDLADKENNLNIIIERYKKLYSDKGVGFRV